MYCMIYLFQKSRKGKFIETKQIIYCSGKEYIVELITDEHEGTFLGNEMFSNNDNYGSLYMY